MITGRPRGLPATSARCASAAFVGAYSSTTRSFISPAATMLRSSSSHSVRSKTPDTVIGLILIPPFGGLISPAANRNVDAPVTGGPKGLFPKGRRVEQRVGTIGQLPFRGAY